MKICKNCGIEKDLIEFHKHPYTKDGRDHRCRDCDNAKSREAWASEKSKIKSNRRERKYGITEDEFQELLKRQNGSCPICLRDLELINIDHDHKTNKVRGLLCTKCNLALGQLGEENIDRAKSYLVNYPSRAMERNRIS